MKASIIKSLIALRIAQHFLAATFNSELQGSCLKYNAKLRTSSEEKVVNLFHCQFSTWSFKGLLTRKRKIDLIEQAKLNTAALDNPLWNKLSYVLHGLIYDPVYIKFCDTQENV